MSAPASTPSPARANAPPPVRVQVQVLSDLHVEFHRDGGAGMIRSLPVLGDVLVVAGDLATRTTLEPAVRLLCDRFPEVVYVAGNHEYYGSSLPRVHDTIARLAARVRNFRWLHHSAAVVAGLRFGGTPLWFRDHPANEAYAHLLNDFNQIRDFRSWVSRENEAGTGFLAGTLPDLDVVVTHHLPAPGSIDPAFATSRLNRFFLCDVSPLVEAEGPPLWVHGHSHASCDYRAGARPTRVVCNPAGYPTEPNPRFVPGLVVEVAPGGAGGRQP